MSMKGPAKTCFKFFDLFEILLPGTGIFEEKKSWIFVLTGYGINVTVVLILQGPAAAGGEPDEEGLRQPDRGPSGYLLPAHRHGGEGSHSLFWAFRRSTFSLPSPLSTVQ